MKRIRPKTRCLLNNSDGSAALEFALLAIPFIVVIFAVIETALLFFSQQVLQTATSQAGRLVMTGQAQSQAMTAAQFKQAVCANAQGMFDCTQLYVNVETFPTFASISTPNPIVNGTLNTSNMNYNLGNPGDIELIQAFYQWPVITGLPGLNIANTGNATLLQSTAVFRNEPY